MSAPTLLLDCAVADVTAVLAGFLGNGCFQGWSAVGIVWIAQKILLLGLEKTRIDGIWTMDRGELGKTTASVSNYKV
jgi:hypothetical protein